MKKNPASFILLCCVTGSFLSGCAGQKYEHASPAPDAGFIPHPELQTNRADLPFQKAWVKPSFDKANYRELIVAPVNTQYMLQMDWWQQTNLRSMEGQFQRDVQELAQYMRNSFIKAFREDPNRRFKVINSPAGGTLQLEMALIEVVPSKPVLNALAYAAPVYGTGTAASVMSPRTVAFEARLRDAQTSEIVATFADRERQDAGPIDLTRLTWYEPARDIIDEWAAQLVQIANRKPGEAVTDPIPITLKPW